MATMRTYDDGCAVAHTLDLVGERWALMVVRELLLGPKHFLGLSPLPEPAAPAGTPRRLADREESDHPTPRRDSFLVFSRALRVRSLSDHKGNVKTVP